MARVGYVRSAAGGGDASAAVAALLAAGCDRTVVDAGAGCPDAALPQVGTPDVGSRPAGPGQVGPGQVGPVGSVGPVGPVGPGEAGSGPDRVLASLLPGDQLVVTRLGELGRTLGEVTALVLRLAERRVDLVVLEQRIDTTDPGGAMLFAVAEAFAGVEAVGRPRRRKGRPSVMTPAKVDAGRRLLRDGTATATAVARQLGVSRSTLYRHCGQDLAGADGATG